MHVCPSELKEKGDDSSILPKSKSISLKMGLPASGFKSMMPYDTKIRASRIKDRCTEEGMASRGDQEIRYHCCYSFKDELYSMSLLCTKSMKLLELVYKRMVLYSLRSKKQERRNTRGTQEMVPKTWIHQNVHNIHCHI